MKYKLTEEGPEIKPDKKTPQSSPIISQKPQKSNEKKFIEIHKDTLLDALYNAINTIKNKPQVLAKDDSKKYYRDFKKYNKTLEELLKLIK